MVRSRGSGAPITHLGRYWSATRREVRLLAVADPATDAEGRIRGEARDVTDAARLPRLRRRFREQLSGPGGALLGSYARLPGPAVELVERLEREGRTVPGWAAEGFPEGSEPVELDALDRDPSPEADHLVVPILPRRALAFGVTYLNSALERETEGRRRDYGYVHRAVRERGERPELFVKGTSPEHFVGPRGLMGLRRDLTNSETLDGAPCERLRAGCGIEPELACVVHSDGTIWGYTAADDVSANRLENETLLYLFQAKYFTGCLVLGPLILVSREQANPGLRIATRIRDAAGGTLFERESSSERINAPLAGLVGWAGSHIALTPGEVLSTGTDVVPEGRVKVLEEGWRVEIEVEGIGRLEHGAAELGPRGQPNPDYDRLELEASG